MLHPSAFIWMALRAIKLFLNTESEIKCVYIVFGRDKSAKSVCELNLRRSISWKIAHRFNSFHFPVVYNDFAWKSGFSHLITASSKRYGLLEICVLDPCPAFYAYFFKWRKTTSKQTMWKIAFMKFSLGKSKQTNAQVRNDQLLRQTKSLILEFQWFDWLESWAKSLTYIFTYQWTHKIDSLLQAQADFMKSHTHANWPHHLRPISESVHSFEVGSSMISIVNCVSSYLNIRIVLVPQIVFYVFHQHK